MKILNSQVPYDLVTTHVRYFVDLIINFFSFKFKILPYRYNTHPFYRKKPHF